MENEITKVEPQQIQQIDNEAPLMVQIVQLLQTGKIDTDQMTAMLEFSERIETNEARKAYHVAMAAFKQDPPTIFKNNTVTYNKGESTVSYKHTTLSNLATILDKSLAIHDLSFTWKTEDLDKGLIKVTCILTHKLGHFESSCMTGLPDATGSKNPIQAKGSTVTYLQRYTLKAVTGVAEEGQDEDGVSACPKPEPPKVRPTSTTELEVIDAICAKLPPAKPGYIINKGHITTILIEKCRDSLVYEKTTKGAEWLMKSFGDADLYEIDNTPSKEIPAEFVSDDQELP